MSLSFALLIAALQVGEPQRSSTPSVERLRVIEDSADAAIRRYAIGWQRAYRLSENARDRADPQYRYRNRFVPRPWNAAAACYPPGHPARYDTVSTAFGRIGGADERSGTCPTWLIKPVVLGDSLGTIDSYLLPAAIAPARAARAALLVRLRELDGVAAGQSERVHSFRVLMHLEQREHSQAAEVAARCPSALAWCAEWQDFVKIRLGGATVTQVSRQLLLADSSDVTSSSLDSATLAHLRTLSPAARGAFEERLWWLADPLWIVAGNERRAEEFARRLDTRARLAQTYDDRYDWRMSVRGGAIATTIMRYGMPDYAWWSGEYYERPRPLYYRAIYYAMGAPRPSNGLQTTFEYFPDRVALVPSFKSVIDPFSTPAWKIHADPSLPDDPWWPQEHMRLPYPLSQLTGQVGLLRRHEHIVAAVGAQLPAAGGAPEPIEVHLVYSRGADSVATVTKRTAFPGSAIALHGSVGRDSEPVNDFETPRG